MEGLLAGGRPFPRGVEYCAGLCYRSLPAGVTRSFGEFRRRLAPHVVPTSIARVSDQVGFGLFAARALPEGGIVGEYAGELTREWRPAGKGRPINPYLLKFPYRCDWAIDASRRGNQTRFINHSEKRRNLRRRWVVHRGVPHVLFVADRNIRRGEQLFLDYGKTYWLDSRPKEL